MTTINYRHAIAMALLASLVLAIAFLFSAKEIITPQPAVEAETESISFSKDHEKGTEAVVAQLKEQSEALARINARIERLEQGLASATSDAESRNRPTPQLDLDTLGPDPEPTMPEARALPTEEEIAEEGRRQILALEAGLAHEGLDLSWAQAHSDDVRAALNSPGFEDLSLMGVDCRSSLCKLEVSWTPEGADSAEMTVHDLSANLMTLEPFQDTEYTIAPSEQYPGEFVIYLARPGGKGLSRFTKPR
jgi:hypothetical protein